MANLKHFNSATGKWEEIKVSTKFKDLLNTVKLTQDQNYVNIGITSYNPAEDVIFIYQNSTWLQKDQDYVVNGGLLRIESKDGSNWSNGDTFNFVVLKNVDKDDLPSADGSLIQNGSITIAKLASSLQTYINKIGTVELVTVADDLSGAINELSSQMSDMGYHDIRNSTIYILENIDKYKGDDIVKTNNFYGNAQYYVQNNSYKVASIAGTETWININNEFYFSKNGELKSLTNNTLKLIPVFPSVINPLMLGLKEGIDVSDIIQACLNTSNSIPLIFPKGTWVLNKTIFLNYNHQVDFSNSTIICSATTNLTNSTLISINSDDITNWKVSYPGTYGFIKNVIINPSNFADTLTAIFCASGFKFEDVEFRHCKRSILFSNNYLDNIIMRNIKNQDYNLDASHVFAFYKEKGGGECFTLDKVQCMGGNLFSIGESYNVSISNVINGNIEIRAGSAVMSNLHLEEGSISIVDSQVSISDSFFYKSKDTSIVPIKCRSISPYTNCGALKVSNCSFNTAFWRKYTTLQQACLDISQYQDVTIENCYSYDLAIASQSITDYYKGSQTGIILYKEGSAFSDFNNNSHYLSKQCIISKGIITTKVNINIIGLKSTQILKNIIASISGNKWIGNSETYTYDCILLVDYNRRILLKNNTTFSVSITNGGSGVELYLQQVGYISDCSIVLYRKSSSDTGYTKYVQFPLTSFYENKPLNDDGLFINGFAWSSLGSPVTNIVSTYNNITNYELDLKNGNVLCKGNAVPTLGTWNLGDRVINSVPATGQPKAWICSVAGTPGTWLSEGTY